MGMVYYRLRLPEGLCIEFEFDEDKSRANRMKHGIDFREATVLWLDEDLAEAPARVSPEERYMVIGTIAGKRWSAVITDRESRIRIISVRRSRASEVALYEGE